MSWQGGEPNDEIGKSSRVGKESRSGEVADVGIEEDSGVVLGVKGPAPSDPFAGGEGAVTGAVQAEGPSPRGGAEEIEDLPVHQGSIQSALMPDPVFCLFSTIRGSRPWMVSIIRCVCFGGPAVTA
jgi:hypothetical protein